MQPFSVPFQPWDLFTRPLPSCLPPLLLPLALVQLVPLPLLIPVLVVV